MNPEQWEELLRGSESESEVSASDVLTQITWKMILVLSLAYILCGQTARAVIQTGNIMGGDKPNILEVVKQRLIRKIDAVCHAQEAKWQLALFPSIDRVAFRNGFPDDAAFKVLFVEACRHLDQAEPFVIRLYGDALRHADAGDGPGDVMYDLFTFPKTAPPDGTKTWNVITPDDDGEALRKYALQRVRDRAAHWRERVLELQLSAIERTLRSPEALQEVGHSDPALMNEQIKSAYKNRGYPLFSGTP